VFNIQIVNASVADIQGGAAFDDGGLISTSYLIAGVVVILRGGWLARSLPIAARHTPPAEGVPSLANTLVKLCTARSTMQKWGVLRIGAAATLSKPRGLLGASPWPPVSIGGHSCAPSGTNCDLLSGSQEPDGD